MNHTRPIMLALLASLCIGGTAYAQDASKLARNFDCNKVRFAQPNWTGVSIKTATASWMLDALGYDTSIKKASLGISYKTIADGKMDVMMAQWMPSQRPVFRKFGIKGNIDIVSPNLIGGGRYTIAVPSYVYKAGVTSIEDLDKHKDKFGGKIYGIDPGSGGNSTIKKMLGDDYAGLGDWKLVASSEPGMLAAVSKHIRNHEWIAFLGWAPHPMNIKYDLKYLSGGEKYWGPDKGKVIVNTVARTGYVWACPNIGQFLDNYNWTVEQQSRAMGYVATDDLKPLAAGKKIIRANPKMLDLWFGRSGIYETGGIKTAKGKDNARQIIADKLGL